MISTHTRPAAPFARHLLSLVALLLIALVAVVPQAVAAADPVTSAKVIPLPGLTNPANAANTADMTSVTNVTNATNVLPTGQSLSDRATQTNYLCATLLNPATQATQTTASFTFDTCASTRLGVFVTVVDGPVSFGNGQMIEAAAATHHVLSLTNLAPGMHYRYRITEINGGDRDTGDFWTQDATVSNVRTQPGVHDVQIWFTLTPGGGPASVIIRGPGIGETRIDYDRAYSAWLQQPGLQPGKTYIFDVLYHDRVTYHGQFTTAAVIDDGTALNPVNG